MCKPPWGANTRNNRKKGVTIGVLKIMSPKRSEFVLATNIPDCELDVLIFHRFNIESNGWNGRHNLRRGGRKGRGRTKKEKERKKGRKRERWMEQGRKPTNAEERQIRKREGNRVRFGQKAFIRKNEAWQGNYRAQNTRERERERER